MNRGSADHSPGAEREADPLELIFVPETQEMEEINETLNTSSPRVIAESPMEEEVQISDNEEIPASNQAGVGQPDPPAHSSPAIPSYQPRRLFTSPERVPELIVPDDHLVALELTQRDNPIMADLENLIRDPTPAPTQVLRTTVNEMMNEWGSSSLNSVMARMSGVDRPGSPAISLVNSEKGANPDNQWGDSFELDETTIQCMDNTVVAAEFDARIRTVTEPDNTDLWGSSDLESVDEATLQNLESFVPATSQGPKSATEDSGIVLENDDLMNVSQIMAAVEESQRRIEPSPIMDVKTPIEAPTEGLIAEPHPVPNITTTQHGTLFRRRHRHRWFARRLLGLVITLTFKDINSKFKTSIFFLS